MQDGQISTTIEYLDWNGDRWSATPKETDVSGLPPRLPLTHDPAWDIVGPWTGWAEWINYVCDNGEHWRCKIRCRYKTVESGVGAGTQIEVRLEHERHDGAGNHEDSEIHFLDHDGHPWRAYCQAVRPPFPGRPAFRFKRM